MSDTQFVTLGIEKEVFAVSVKADRYTRVNWNSNCITGIRHGLDGFDIRFDCPHLFLTTDIMLTGRSGPLQRTSAAALSHLTKIPA